jgi:glycosyltransferase involved in cell wall biosynthesis
VGGAHVVHTSIAHDVARPTPFFAILFAILRRRKSLFVVDVDFRDKARQWRTLGLWSRRAYWRSRFVLDPLRRLQVWLAVRLCSLCLLKSAKLVADYGGGRPQVRNFFNTAHSAEHVISEARLAEKLARLRDPSVPLRLVFFGRFVKYKGLDRTIRAVAIAREKSARPFELWLVGHGDQHASLAALVDELDARSWVSFREPVPFGPRLFELLQACSLCVATPLVEDTPRAAFDAMACGLPVLGYDVVYYRDLRATGAVETSPWPDVEQLANRIVALDADRERLARMAARGVTVARENTQEIWLDRRVRWTLELLD